MKQKTLSFLLAVLMSMVANMASAYDAKIDGIYYNFNDTKATVTYQYYYDDNQHAYSGSVTIPESVTYSGKTYSVTSIGNYAFSDCWGLRSIEIPNSVTSIGSSAFRDCTGLTSVTINSNAIASKAYTSSSRLSEIFGSQVTSYTFGEGVEEIGDYACYNLPNITNLNLPETLTSIGSNAFRGCTGLTSAKIPNAVTTVNSNAFQNCTGLTSVHISDLAAWCGISFGGSSANPLTNAHHLYLNGEEVKELVVPDGVETIGSYAFYNGSEITAVTIPSSITSIGGSAFSGCTGLTSVEIPYSVTSIGKDAFKECTGLARTDYASIESLLGIQFGNSYANPLYYTKALNVGGKIVTELEIPENVAAINSFAFYNCNSIKKVTGGKNVTSIGKSAFYNNVKLTSVQIGGKVEEIKDYAFNKCPLTTVYNYAATPQNCGIETFSIDKSTCNLYVLPESVEQYENHQDWYEFNINAMDAETVGVEAIGNGQLTMDNAKGVYDLSGRKMNANVNDNVNVNNNVNNSKFGIQNSKLKKGIYIVNGKKLLKR